MPKKKSITKDQFVRLVAEECALPNGAVYELKAIRAVLDAVPAVVLRELRKDGVEKVRIPGLVTITRREKKAWTSAIDGKSYPATRVLSAKITQAMKSAWKEDSGS